MYFYFSHFTEENNIRGGRGIGSGLRLPCCCSSLMQFTCYFCILSASIVSVYFPSRLLPSPPAPIITFVLPLNLFFCSSLNKNIPIIYYDKSKMSATEWEQNCCSSFSLFGVFFFNTYVGSLYKMLLLSLLPFRKTNELKMMKKKKYWKISAINIENNSARFFYLHNFRINCEWIFCSTMRGREVGGCLGCGWWWWRRAILSAGNDWQIIRLLSLVEFCVKEWLRIESRTQNRHE